MHFLLKHGDIPASYVSLPEGVYVYIYIFTFAYTFGHRSILALVVGGRDSTNPRR